MAYLAPYFTFDIFVSYSHGDPHGEGDSLLESWTRELIHELRRDIKSLKSEFASLNIWCDEQFDPTVHLTPELRAKVKDSGILFIVMSEWYLQSTWCKDELDWFREQIRDRSRDQGRVFVIRVQPTAETSWPDFLRDDRGHALPGFRFHDANKDSPYGWRGVAEVEYIKRLDTLRTAVVARLRELKERAQARVEARADQAPQPRSRGGRIYLHAQAKDTAECEEVGRLLEQDGIRPLSLKRNAGNALGDWSSESKLRFEMAKRCDALALVRADDDESFLGDLLEVGVDERERLQSTLGAPLPCAVLDRSGKNLPMIDLAGLGIERFDLRSGSWRGDFQQWFDQAHLQPAVPAP